MTDEDRSIDAQLGLRMALERALYGHELQPPVTMTVTDGCALATHIEVDRDMRQGGTVPNCGMLLLPLDAVAMDGSGKLTMFTISDEREKI